MVSSNDNVLLRRTFSRGKTDGTLGTLRLLVWMYRFGALGLAGYFLWSFSGLVQICIQFCGSAAEDGVLYLTVIDFLFHILIIIGHVVAIGLTIPIMRWRQQWIDGRPAFHPDIVFAYFTAVAAINPIIFLVQSIYLFVFRNTFGGGLDMTFAVVGGAFVAFFVHRLWSINIHQPSGGRMTVTQPAIQYQAPTAPYPGYTPVSAPQPGTYQAYASPAAQSGGYQAPPPLASYTGYNAAPAVNGGAPPPLASYTGAPATTAPPYYPPYNAAPAPSLAAPAQPAMQYVYTTDPSLAGKTVPA
ncbi:hypothetical protein BJ742DRAFT_130614 [Cladochytrium replicatum]|nr:hypothetical protein BJ742DRAFT_130614 [Cladochytrium replicatum]